MHYEQLGLGTVLARAQACDGVGPAVELPGLGHVVDADDEGQAAREECVSQLRVKDQVVAPSRTIVVHAAAGENVRRVSVDALVRRRAERVDRLARPGAARSHCTVAADAARCSVPAGAAVRRSPTFAQQDVRAGGPAPGTASLSARQEVPGVEVPVHPAPHQAQQGAQEDRVLP